MPHLPVRAAVATLSAVAGLTLTGPLPAQAAPHQAASPSQDRQSVPHVTGQKAVDKLFSFGGFRGENEESPVHLARNFRRLAGFSDDEIAELVDISAEAYAEAQAKSAERAALVAKRRNHMQHAAGA